MTPWLAVIALWLALSIPDTIRVGLPSLASLRGSGDLLAMLSLAAASYHVSWGRYVRPVIAVYASLLVLFQLDRMVVRLIMDEEPLLYDQLFMFRHLLVLIWDLWSLATALGLLAFFMVLAALAWVAAKLLRRMRVLVEPDRVQQTRHVVLAAWLVALAGTVTDSVHLTVRPLVRWLSPALAENVQASIETYQAAQRNVTETPYDGYGRITLTRKPDFHIYVVESYGKLAFEHPDMRARHAALLEELGPKLQDAGWSVVSAYSEAPVRGARSWLADVTMLTGAPVQYEALFTQIKPRLGKRMTLPAFFQRQGYDTIFVSPADRERAGMHRENLFGYTHLIDFDVLDYRGPHVGWGLVPDQFSLGYVRERVIAAAKRPTFLNFHLVASHAPWADIPDIVSDWTALGRGERPAAPDKDQDVYKAFRRAVRFGREANYVGFKPLQGKLVDGYVRGLEHDFRLLVDQLTRDTSDNRIVVLIGDHQPPLIASLKSSYDTPVHVLARDPELLAELSARGFKNGLDLPPKRAAVTTHAGLFSLFVRTLARCSAATGTRLPPFLRGGQQLVPPVDGRIRVP